MEFYSLYCMSVELLVCVTEKSSIFVWERLNAQITYGMV